MANKSQLPPVGVYVPVPTFFDTNASFVHTPPLDLQAQRDHAIHLARSGITGIVLLGSTGEAVSLTNDERKRIIGAVRKALDEAGFKEYPIVAGTATYGVQETIQQCQEAMRAGADYAMCLAPGFFAAQTGVDATAKWFEAVAGASPLPVIVYNYPSVTNGLVLPAKLFTRLAKNPNIVGAKLSHGDISVLAQITTVEASSPDKFRVYTGLGNLLVPFMSVGGAGAIDGLAAIFPRVMVRLYGAHRQVQYSGPEHGAHLKQAMIDLQGDVSRAWGLVMKGGIPAIKAAITRELKIGIEDATRLPVTGGMPEGLYEEYEEAFAKLRKTEQMLKDHRVNVEQKE